MWGWQGRAGQGRAGQGGLWMTTLKPFAGFWGVGAGPGTLVHLVHKGGSDQSYKHHANRHLQAIEVSCHLAA